MGRGGLRLFALRIVEEFLSGCLTICANGLEREAAELVEEWCEQLLLCVGSWCHWGGSRAAVIASHCERAGSQT